MYKQHLLQNIEREIILTKRLASIIEEKDLDYKPSEKTRTTHELMQYLSRIGANMLRWFVVNDLNPEEWAKIREHAKTVTIANFSERLDQQLHDIHQYFNQISEDDLMHKEVTLPWGEKLPLGAAIISAPIKWLAAYRMQLFSYLKANGRLELGTKEAWVPEVAAAQS